MIQWNKKGLIYCPNNKDGWNNNSFMTPSATLINNSTIRIFGGIRDDEGKSRISYIDVNAENPKEIIQIAKQPVADLGKPGCFDDNGMILGSVLKLKDEIRLYYIGFQLVKQVKFLAFSGLAYFKGDNVIRHSDSPIMDRYNSETYIRAIHTVLYEDGIYKIWYSTGNKWEIIDNIPYPQYKINYAESVDGIIINNETIVECIDVRDREYRIGRPVVFKHDGLYKMFYTSDTLEKKYTPGYAESLDGRIWERKDHLMLLTVSDNGWDSEMVCYPFPLFYKDRCYVFYNGNGMGKTGVGYAEIYFR